MPELPDVEGFRRVLDRHALGERVDKVEAPDASVIRNTTASGLGRALKGRRFTETERLGKWLLARSEGSSVLFHFGMTGSLVWSTSTDDRHPHDRVVFLMGHGELRFRDQRKLRGLWLARDEDAVADVIGDQGPDAYGLSRAEIGRRLDGHRGAVKSTLMDQSVVAGLGNLLTDEICWRARIHPSRRADKLDDDELRRLHRAWGTILKASVDDGRVPPRRSWLTGARDDDEPSCPRCGSTLRDSRVGGRRSWWCPRCQPKTE